MNKDGELRNTEQNKDKHSVVTEKKNIFDVGKARVNPDWLCLCLMQLLQNAVSRVVC